MIKRLLDFFASLFGLLVTSPVLIPVMFLVWLEDKHNPFYIAPRVGRNEVPFRMVKMRSMVINADRSGVDSTSANDNRITSVGQFIRRYKLDELTQLWNVLVGDMSLVGPRPNVKNETDLYTAEEKRLLSTKPGITDFSSIVFSDEGDILAGRADPDLAYNQLIRPWKSKLGLLYVDHQSLLIDIKLVVLTVLAVVNRPIALNAVHSMLTDIGADEDVVQVSLRQSALVPSVPPGSDKIVTARQVSSV
jgi:lipopolysaccharide/colanic/teichoic acid biosynthesis glycosyltransferase